MPRASDDLVRKPKQERSRRSLARAVEAATALMVERRSGEFTLAEVGVRSGVSIGSIYARVRSKEDLIRVAHARLMEGLSHQTMRTFASTAEPAGAPLRDVVSRAVRLLAGLLRTNSSELAPFMTIAQRDPVIADRGKHAHEQMVAAFGGLLLSAGPAIGHPHPDRAVSWSCTVVYSVLARQLGLGSDLDAAVAHPWEALVEDLTDMVTAYLAGAGEGVSGSSMGTISN